MDILCLNCNAGLSGKYCSNCGQKAATHQITFKRFVAHDLLHGTFHLDRGILFTIKEALLRPGKAALDYISGKRVRYYNVFYLSLLLIALNVLHWHFWDGRIYGKLAIRENSEFVDFLGKNLQVIVLCIVPLFAINGWLIFKKLRLNLSEHFILGGISLLGILVFTLPFVAATFISQIYPNVGLGKILLIIPIIFYPAWTYRNATKGLYNFGPFFGRISLFMLFLFLQIAAITYCIALLVTGDSTFEIHI